MTTSEEHQKTMEVGATSQNLDTISQQIILSYLVFNCHEETALSFAQSSGLDLSNLTVSQDKDGDHEMSQNTNNLYKLDSRKSLDLVSVLTSGNIGNAIDLCHAHFPGLLIRILDLEKENTDWDRKSLDLSFELYCQYFIELVKCDQQNEALLFAQTTLSKFGLLKTEYLESLRDVVALIAYQNPLESPVSSLMSHEHREFISHHINSSIMVSLNQPKITALEAIVKQLTVVKDVAGDDNKRSRKKKWTIDEIFANLDPKKTS